jgi:Protein of unknown function (DUF2846)
MKVTRRVCLAAFAVFLVAGCASGPKYTEIKGKIPSLQSGQGRVFVYRDSTFGAAVTPDVLINGKVVGVSRANGFFYTDLPAGNHKLSAGTEVERSLSFTLASGENKYVRSSMSFGVMVGRINFDLVNQAAGEAALADLAYTGGEQ